MVVSENRGTKQNEQRSGHHGFVDAGVRLGRDVRDISAITGSRTEEMRVGKSYGKEEM